MLAVVVVRHFKILEQVVLAVLAVAVLEQMELEQTVQMAQPIVAVVAVQINILAVAHQLAVLVVQV
jgi:hypothetical protein